MVGTAEADTGRTVPLNVFEVCNLRFAQTFPTILLTNRDDSRNRKHDSPYALLPVRPRSRSQHRTHPTAITKHRVSGSGYGHSVVFTWTTPSSHSLTCG